MSSRRPLTALILLAIASPLLAGMAQPPMAEARGQLALRFGQYAEARDLFAQAAESQPEARVWEGDANYHLGHTEQAVEAWQLAARDPRSARAAGAAIAGARAQLKALLGLLDRYGAMRVRSPRADEWRDLAGQFDGLARSAAGTLVGRRSALMAADCLAYAGEGAEAVRRFDAAKDNLPAVADWALSRMAAVDPARAGEYLGTLVARFPDSPLLASAKVALAEKESDPAARRQALVRVVSAGDRGPGLERAYYLLGAAPGADRASWLVKYWNRYPEGKYLDEVVKALAKLPGLSTDTNYRIGSYFYFASDYGPATRYFAKVPTSMARYRAARAYWGLNDLARAASGLKAVAGADRSLAARAYLTLGQVEAQRGKVGPAIQAYQRAASLGGEPGVTAKWKISRIYRDQHKFAQADGLEHWIIVNAPWSEEATSILWQQFWRAYQAHRLPDAVVNAKRLAQHHPNDLAGQAAQYWLGRIDERVGDRAGALASYRTLVGRSPASYYGWRAHWRYQAVSGRGADPGFATQPGRVVQEMPIRWHDLLNQPERALLAGERGTPLPQEMKDWPAGMRELVFLRQFDVADGMTAASKSPNLKAWMSFLQLRYRQAIREEKGEPRLAYPLGFAPLLIAAANRHGVDPLLLAALVREESRFDPQIKSWVGATGLAQLMPDTARYVMKNVPDFAGRPLTDPATNLQLGAWYLANTHKIFDGNSMNAVAAYNGGPGAVAKWKRQFGGAPDEFVENIPYKETREYVMKVFSSYWNYVRLYGS